MSKIDDQAATWMVLRTERQLNDLESREFDAWYAADTRHQGAYLRAMAVNNALNRATVQHNLRPQPIPAEPVLDGYARRRTFAAFGGLAAGLLLAVGLFTTTGTSSVTDWSTSKGETRQVRLADQSLVNLNSASEVEVHITDKARQLKLKQGEAWFQVAKNKHKPFVVEAGAVRVRAVGTAFSVRRYRDGADILVTEGVVEVWSSQGSGERVLLAQGEQVFVPEAAAKIKVARAPDEVERKLAWRNGKIIFNDQTLGDAVADFNRYSPRKIVIQDARIMRMKFIGQYAIDAPELFAKDVSSYLDVPLVITADAIMIGEAKPISRPHGKDKG
jgi:transmembrane sensor